MREFEDFMTEMLEEYNYDKNTLTVTTAFSQALAIRWFEKQLGKSNNISNGYFCKNLNGEDAVIVADCISDVFDKLDDITPNPEQVKVSSKSIALYF